MGAFMVRARQRRFGAPLSFGASASAAEMPKLNMMFTKQRMNFDNDARGDGGRWSGGSEWNERETAYENEW